MVGDLLSSFVKRIGPGHKQPGDRFGSQVPESLLPALACASSLQLTLLDVIATTATFFIGEIALSKILYKMHIRARPFLAAPLSRPLQAMEGNLGRAIKPGKYNGRAHTDCSVSLHLMILPASPAHVSGQD